MGGKKSFPGGGNAWSGLRGLNLPFCLFRVRGNGQHLVVARNQHGVWGGVMKMKVGRRVGGPEPLEC